MKVTLLKITQDGNTLYGKFQVSYFFGLIKYIEYAHRKRWSGYWKYIGTEKHTPGTHFETAEIRFSMEHDNKWKKIRKELDEMEK